MFETGPLRCADTVISADGAGSVVRHAMEAQIEGSSVSSVFLEHAYKELHIPPQTAGASLFAIEQNALHIWPRHKYMMIALPNLDGSFTCTLFPAQHSEAGSDGPSFEKLVDEQSLMDFYRAEFPDAVPLMPTLAEDFFTNPTGQLGTVKCWPWNAGGKALLLGDAAHAVVPFYGQGMTARSRIYACLIS